MTDWLIEAARRPIRKPTGLPLGLIRKDGKIVFECRACEQWTEWPTDIEDFDVNNPNNLCGGSPRCCP